MPGGRAEESIFECPALPRGWKKREVVRKSGLSKGKIDVYYVSPSGKTIRSKVQLIRYLGSAVDLTDFDYQAGVYTSCDGRVGKSRSGDMRPKTAAGAGKGGHHVNGGGRGSAKVALVSTTRNGFDGPLNPPSRHSAIIGQHSITLVHTTSKDTKPAPAAEVIRTSRQEKPRQLFWARRLENLRPMIVRLGESVDKAQLEPLSLTNRLIPAGPGVTEEAALASLAATLHHPPTSGVPLTGQTAAKKCLDSNAGVFTNPDQPLVQAVVITDQEILLQERRVLDARRRLEEALKHFG